MSRNAGLQKLSVEYIRVYRFKNNSGTEHGDYLIKMELDEKSKEPCFAVYYGFLRLHYLFLFNHDSASCCRQVINLKNCTVSDCQPDRRWPSCCSAGCQILPPGCDGHALSPGSWQLGFFPGSKWKRCLEAHYSSGGGGAGSAAADNDATDSDYDNDEYDASDPELSGLWATLADLDPGQLSSSAASAAAGGVAKPPRPGPKPLKPSLEAAGQSVSATGPPKPVRRTPVTQRSLLDAPTPAVPLAVLEPTLPPQQPTPLTSAVAAAVTALGRPATPQQPPLPPKQPAQLPPKETPQPSAAFAAAAAAVAAATGATTLTPKEPRLPPKEPLLPSKEPPLPPKEPPLPPKEPPLPRKEAPTQPQSATPSNLYDLMISGSSVDSLCSYFCRGYYSSKDMAQARHVMKRASDDGAYMLRGFCNAQAGQDKTLCIKYGMVYKFRVRVLPNGYQIWNECNDLVHGTMEALLFHHHVFPIRVAQQIQHELLLRRPYDLDRPPQSGASSSTNALSAALWNHGTKEQCAEILKCSEDGTYTVRGDPSGAIVLCVTHHGQILKFRIVVSKTVTGTEFWFHHQQGSLKFPSLEDFLVYYHKNPIRGSSADGDILLRVPFQLVHRCQQELDFQQLALDSIFSTDPVETATNKVSRMKSGNFLFRRSVGGSGEHALIVRGDDGLVRTFRISEKDTDLCFRPQKIFTLEDKPELVTDRIEKMIHYLCGAIHFLSPEIKILVKP